MAHKVVKHDNEDGVEQGRYNVAIKPSFIMIQIYNCWCHFIWNGKCMISLYFHKKIASASFIAE